MGLNIRIYNIVSDGNYSIRYKSGDSPYPETNDSTFTLYNTGLTASTITISGLSFDTQYWIKMTDETTNRYIIKNIYTHDSKAFPCYDTMCFDVQTICVSPSPTPTPTPSITPSITPTISQTPTVTPSITPSITPSLTPTPTKTPTPTPTPSCQYLSWTINHCTTGTCSGICTCGGSTPLTVYTQCNVSELTGVGTAIYTNTSLTNPFTGDFMHSSSPNDIFNSTGSGVSYVCTVGGGC